jgi:hypothetical protein
MVPWPLVGIALVGIVGVVVLVLFFHGASSRDEAADQPDGDWVDLSRLPAECRGERFPRK